MVLALCRNHRTDTGPEAGRHGDPKAETAGTPQPCLRKDRTDRKDQNSAGLRAGIFPGGAGDAGPSARHPFLPYPLIGFKSDLLRCLPGGRGSRVFSRLESRISGLYYMGTSWRSGPRVFLQRPCPCKSLPKERSGRHRPQARGQTVTRRGPSLLTSDNRGRQEPRPWSQVPGVSELRCCWRDHAPCPACSRHVSLLLILIPLSEDGSDLTAHASHYLKNLFD